MGIRLSEFDKLHFFPTYFINSYTHVESVLNHSRTFIDKIRQKLHTNNNTNRKSLPINVTIRKEYINVEKVLAQVQTWSISLCILERKRKT